jgi:hypothetical protein
MSIIVTGLLGAAALAAFMALRLWPIWRVRTRGCDAYNILLCAEDVRRNRRVPPNIPNLFILEQPQQWYPPLFFVLTALAPGRWLRERFWLFNQYVDLANAILLFGFVTAFVGPMPGAVCVLMYAIAAGLVQEFATLTTRPLGLLAVNALLLAGYVASQDIRWAPLALLCGIAVIYAHKLSAQQIWFTLPLLTLATGDARWLALLGAIYLGAFLIWPHGFRRVIDGHVAIVRFWHRNWPMLGAHGVRQSPVYGDNVTHNELYAEWQHGSKFVFFKQALHQNYFVVPALIGAATFGSGSPLLIFCAAWIVSVYVAASAVHFIAPLRGIGLGQQYVKFAVFPSLAAVAIIVGAGAPLWLLALIAGAALLALRQYVLVTKLLRGDPGAVADLRTPDLDRLLLRLADDAQARIMVLPYQLCDLVAYVTRRPVYWGTHGQVFDRKLEEFFPVLRRPLADYVKSDGLNRLLLDTRYAQIHELNLTDTDVIERAGAYVLLALKLSLEATENTSHKALAG